MADDHTEIRLLLIEDNPSDVFLFKANLARADGNEFQTEVVERLSEAIAFLDNCYVDAVVTDLNLPDSVGVDTVKRLVESAGQAPIIALTGWEDPILGALSIENGAACFWSKDRIGDGDLPGAIARIIQRSSTNA